MKFAGRSNLTFQEVCTGGGGGGTPLPLRIALPWIPEPQAWEEFQAAELGSPRRRAMEKRWNRIEQWRHGDAPLEQQEPVSYEIEQHRASAQELAEARAAARKVPAVRKGTWHHVGGSKQRA